MALKVLLGNEAIAYGAVEAGVHVATGYPGTPSSEVLGTLAVLAREKGFYVEWSTNEKVALEVAAGAALAGARAMVTMKQVGLNVAADALMTLAYLGIEGGLVLVVADDPGPHSSQNEQDTRLFGRFAKVPVLDPATPREARDMAVFAFDLSETLKLPVILRPTTRVSHVCQEVDVNETYDPRPVPGFVKDPRWVCMPAVARARHPWLNAQQEKARELLAASPFNEIQLTNRLGIIACGVSYNYVVEALARLGAAASLLKVGTPYPLPERPVLDFLRRVDRVLVVEELEPVVEEQVAALAYRHNLRLPVAGKYDGTIPREGEFDVDRIAPAVAAFLGVPYAPPERHALPPLPERGPVLCAGCPHRASFYIFKEAARGTNAIFTGDIGCYTLGLASPLKAVHTCLCMGASIGMAAGLWRADPKRKCIAFLGDSTFFHNGVPGLIDAVYNRADIVVVVLDNRTTAMTGHQPHPGTGRTATGEATREISIAKLAKACGVNFVREVDPLNGKEAFAVAVEALRRRGPSVVVMKSPCTQLLKPQGRYRVNPEKCSGFKFCVDTLACPAILPGEEYPVITDKCVGCGFCATVCPADAIEKVVET
ncbi:MAG: indolepyruvate ferredoxin oxidoreductase subunit alpha [Bacillota bacterium]